MILYEDFLGLVTDAKEFDRYILGLCPFHPDSSPSLLVWKDGWFRCLGCGRNGTWKTLWNKLKGQPVQIRSERKTSWNAPTADDWEEACYQAHEDLISFPSFGWYLEMRGLSDVIDTCDLGYLDGWYTVPIYAKSGEFSAAVLRAAPHVADAGGFRYYSPQGPTMYVPNWHRFNTSDCLFVVFGMFDALALFKLGFSSATSTAGQGQFHPEWLNDYRKKVVVLPDKGEEKAAHALAASLGWRGQVLRLNYPDGIKDPAGFLEANREDELRSMLGAWA